MVCGAVCDDATGRLSADAPLSCCWLSASHFWVSALWSAFFAASGSATRAPLLKLVLAGSLLMFVALGFGARLSHDYENAAFQFMYFTGTLLALVVIDRDDRLAAACETKQGI